MTVFLNKQKSINDLKNNAKNKSDGFMRIRLETMDTLVHDVNYKDPLIDSVMQYWKVYQSLQKDSSALQFSIDSLSKMK